MGDADWAQPCEFGRELEYDDTPEPSFLECDHVGKVLSEWERRIGTGSIDVDQDTGALIMLLIHKIREARRLP